MIAPFVWRDVARLSFMRDFNALSTGCQELFMIFRGELDENSHEIFEVLNNQSIPFIGSVDYGKEEAKIQFAILKES